jgi:hypothetical protein
MRNQQLNLTVCYWNRMSDNQQSASIANDDAGKKIPLSNHHSIAAAIG